MELIAQVKVGRTRCSRFSHTLFNLLQLAMILAVAGKLGMPEMLPVKLLDDWRQSAVVDVIVAASRDQCKSPDFLVFEYQFKGMTIGCSCDDLIVHSGYCTKKQIDAGCDETTPIYARNLSNYNTTTYLCAKTAIMQNCDRCPSGFCSVTDSDPCPVLDIQLGVFPPSSSYTAVAHVDAVGRILFISRNVSNMCPVCNITTIKGTEVCLDPNAQNTKNFTSLIYKEVTLLQKQCLFGGDPRFRLLSSIPDYVMYASNNLTLISEGNYFSTFVKSLPLITNSSVEPALQMGRLGCRFIDLIVLLTISCVLVFIAQQLILHRYQSAKQLFANRYSTALLMVTYFIDMIIASYCYSRLSEYMNLRSRITLFDEQSSKDMAQLMNQVQDSAKVLLALASSSGLAATVQLVVFIVECRKMCRRANVEESMSENKQ